jgi:hypothetical protein
MHTSASKGVSLVRMLEESVPSIMEDCVLDAKDKHIQYKIAGAPSNALIARVNELQNEKSVPMLDKNSTNADYAVYHVNNAPKEALAKAEGKSEAAARKATAKQVRTHIAPSQGAQAGA